MKWATAIQKCSTWCRKPRNYRDSCTHNLTVHSHKCAAFSFGKQHSNKVQRIQHVKSMCGKACSSWTCGTLRLWTSWTLNSWGSCMFCFDLTELDRCCILDSAGFLYGLFELCHGCIFNSYFWMVHSLHLLEEFSFIKGIFPTLWWMYFSLVDHELGWNSFRTSLGIFWRSSRISSEI